MSCQAFGPFHVGLKNNVVYKTSKYKDIFWLHTFKAKRKHQLWNFLSRKLQITRYIILNTYKPDWFMQWLPMKVYQNKHLLLSKNIVVLFPLHANWACYTYRSQHVVGLWDSNIPPCCMVRWSRHSQVWDSVGRREMFQVVTNRYNARPVGRHPRDKVGVNTATQWGAG